MIEKKHLVACGCSFTQGHHLAKQGISWPAYVANKKKLNLHNIACGGMGNEWITQQTMGFLESNPDIRANAIVMIGWSDVGRLMTGFNPDPHSDNTCTEIFSLSPIDFEKFRQAEWLTSSKFHMSVKNNSKVLESFFGSYSYCFMKTYMAMFFLKTYLELHNIPYVFFDALASNKIIHINRIHSTGWRSEIQMLDSCGDVITLTESVPCTLDQNYFLLNKGIIDSIYDEHFITFNGKSLLTSMRENYAFYTEGNGGHPNHNACDYFSDIIINEYDKLY